MEPGIMKVELDIFSGRENPAWNLSREESEVLIEKLRPLTEIKSEASVWNGLGYRGIIVRCGSIEGEDISEIKFYNETIRITIKNVTLTYSDPGRTLELWLTKTGKSRIENQLYKSIITEITKKAEQSNGL